MFLFLQVTSDISGLSSTARTYHIHVLPVDIQAIGAGQCSSESVEGHFDPFGIGDSKWSDQS